jgi:type IV secretory pathway VirB9-like protein
MKKIRFLFLLLAFSLAKVVIAQVITEQIATGNDVISVPVRVGMPTALEFDSVIGEVIISGVDDWTQKLEMEKHSNRLLLKPYKEFSMNMLVLTAKQSYSVELKATKNDKFYSILRLKNAPPPPLLDEAAIAKINEAQIKKRIAEHEAEAKLERDKRVNEFLTKNREKNLKYSVEIMTPNPSIIPETVYDDGVFTFIGFQKNQKIPAIYEFDAATSEETPLNFHIEPNGLYVIQSIVRTLVLRRGKEELAIHNDSFNINGAVTGKRTSEATNNLEKK